MVYARHFHILISFVLHQMGCVTRILLFQVSYVLRLLLYSALTQTQNTLVELWRKYLKIPKISPGAYIFQRPLWRGLFLEGPIFGGAYVRREICVSKSIGLACSEKEIYHFCLCIWGQIPSTRPPQGAYIWRSDLTEGFLALRFGGLIFGRAYTWRDLFSEFYGITQVSSRSSNHNIFL